MRGGDRVGIVRVGTKRSVSACLVHRGVGGRDDGGAAGHRLDDRHPEALEAGRVGGDGGTTIERGELVVRDEAEAADTRVVEHRLLAPAFPTDDGEQGVPAEQAVRSGESLEVLAGFERCDRDDVRRPELGPRPSRGEDGLDPRRCHADPGRRHAEQLRHVTTRVGRVDEDDVAASGCVAVLPAVHRPRPFRRPFRETGRGRDRGSSWSGRRSAVPDTSNR